MMANHFDIKIALLGYVSVGKSTVLNALLGKKYSEVSMKRTTAGINFFNALHQQPSIACTGTEDAGTGTDGGIDNESTTGSPTPAEWNVVQDGNVRSASSTLEEIEADNQRLRKSNTIEEKHFDIQLKQPLVQMRKDARLVIVDIPGINEAGTSSMYKKYVQDSWSSFDCAIIVMDAHQGVNTDEQVEILKFVKDNNTNHKNIPIVIVGNKIDDPDDEEELELVAEVRAKVEEIFGAGCSEDALHRIKAARAKGEHWNYGGDDSNKTKEEVHQEGDFAAFVPMSAMRAFFYRSAYGLPIDEFKKLDMKLIDKLGQEEVSRIKWKKMDVDEKIKVVHDAIQDPEDYQERLEATNFDCFLSVLEYCLGGEKAQAKLIKKQLEVELDTFPAEHLAACLRQTYKKCISIGESPDIIKPAFWKIYDISKAEAFGTMDEDISPAEIGKSMKYLSEYDEVVKELGWQDESDKAVDGMRLLVEDYLLTILDKFEPWDAESWYAASRSVDKLSWKNSALAWPTLSPRDWLVIAQSVLLISSEKYFIEWFGQEKQRLIGVADKMSHYCDGSKYLQTPLLPCTRFQCYQCRTPNCQASTNCPSCLECTNCAANKATVQMFHNISEALKGSYKRDQFVPADAHAYACVVQLEMPKSPSDPEHFGHIIWEYCRYRESQQK